MRNKDEHPTRVRFATAGCLLLAAIGCGVTGILVKSGQTAALLPKQTVVVNKLPVSGKVVWRMSAKENVISTCYKAYGLKDLDEPPMWLANLIFKNGMTGRVTDLEVRWRVPEFSEWPTQRFTAIDPNQSIVALFYPRFSSKLGLIQNSTPTDVEMEASYVDADGNKRSFSDRTQIRLLGRNEAIFTDIKHSEAGASFWERLTLGPLIAAWVTPKDPVVAELASIANKNAGGHGAGDSKENFVRICEQIWQTLQSIHITYQHPASVVGKESSWDPFFTQVVQLPRDTIQKRSGTCIDLAVLVASMLESVGISSELLFCPGHVYPIAVWRGQELPIEATLVGSSSFADAVTRATNNYAKDTQSLQFLKVQCADWWSKGITPPELESLPPDILERWGITQLLARTGTKTSEAERAPGGKGMIASGEWSWVLINTMGRQSKGAAGVKVVGSDVMILCQLSYPITGPDGSTHQGVEQNTFRGSNADGTLQLRCNEAKWYLDGQPVNPVGLPFVMELKADAGGRSMSGQFASGAGAQGRISFEYVKPFTP